MDKIKIFDPPTVVQAETFTFSLRPESLRGLHIGLVENTKFNSDKVLLRIASILEQDYGAKSHVIRSKHNAGVPAHEELIDELAAACDVAIAGIGD